jgi:Uma2 family endonuclease
MTIVMNQPTAANPTAAPLSLLQNGDRLTRIEFERRYAAMPQVNKAQLIEGVVFMPSPVSHTNHGNPHFNLIGWLSTYTMYSPGVEGGDNSTLRLDLDNAPQPDAYLIILPTHGGQVRIDAEGYIVGAPELIAEVSATSVSMDLHGKLNAYRRNGVKEYVVWRVLEQAIDWFVLRAGRFDPLPMIGAHYHSEVFPGLRLDPDALINGDMVRVSQVLQQGLATPEHASFVTKLQQAAARPSQP